MKVVIFFFVMVMSLLGCGPGVLNTASDGTQVTSAPPRTSEETTPTPTPSATSTPTPTATPPRTWKYIFRTQAPNGNLAAVVGATHGVQGADLLCNASGSKPAGAGTLKAMIVDGVNRRACNTANCTGAGTAEQIDWVFQASTEYRRVDGTTKVLDTDTNKLITFPLVATVGGSAGSHHFTGMNEDFTENATNCSNWTISTPGQNGGTGRVDRTNNQFLKNDPTGRDCSNTIEFIVCVEQ